MREETLSGKIAVVTGGSRGIGNHIARALHEAGATVAITSRYEKAVEEATNRIGGSCHGWVCDQRDEKAVERFSENVLTTLGTPDILVNNAGLMRGGAIKDLNLRQWSEVIETNLTGVFLMTRAFLPSMMEKGRGDVFMISSMSGKKGDPGSAAYSASKFGLQGFSQSLTHEVRRHNIRVMVLNPSSVNTGEDTGPAHGPGLHLHAADLAAMIVHLARLPGRTLFRDVDIWGTNPF